jgi:hypothetical protein
MFGDIPRDAGRFKPYMGAVPGSIQTDQQQPMWIPLQHFFIGLVFLLVGSLLGVGAVSGIGAPFTSLVHVHLLLVGWICITIMGAMTQFVPVWSGVALYSRRLASIQLPIVVIGLVGFGISLLLGHPSLLIGFGAVMCLGFWVFVYNVARTLRSIESLDVTERHFAFALACFVGVTILGYGLAVDFTIPFLDRIAESRSHVRSAHITLALFGAVLSTVYGALYQLVKMFTQTEYRGIDLALQRIEKTVHPIGTVLLVVGRYVDSLVVGRIGAGMILLAAVAVGIVVARKLAEMRVPWTPMHTRYAIVAAALPLWAILTAPAWLRDPTISKHLIGVQEATHLFVIGVLGFVVFGTLYHVVPFIVWINRYSDQLGHGDVPMIDDLYFDRLAALDGTLLVTGTIALVLAEAEVVSGVGAILGGILVCLGIVVFTANMVVVLRFHSSHSFGELLLGSTLPPFGRHSGSRSEDTTPE